MALFQVWDEVEDEEGRLENDYSLQRKWVVRRIKKEEEEEKDGKMAA